MVIRRIDTGLEMNADGTLPLVSRFPMDAQNDEQISEVSEAESVLTVHQKTLVYLARLALKANLHHDLKENRRIFVQAAADVAKTVDQRLAAEGPEQASNLLHILQVVEQTAAAMIGVLHARLTRTA